MSLRGKPLVYVCIGAACLLLLGLQAAVWIRSEEPPRKPNLSADGKPLAGSTSIAPASGEAAELEPAAANERSDLEKSESELVLAADGGRVAALDRSLGLIQNFVASSRGQKLDELARAWSAAENPPPQAPPENEWTVSEERRTPLEVESPPTPAADPLRAFLAQHPIEAILCGREEQAVMLGGWILRTGDELPDGLGLIASIEPRCVRLAAGERELRLELPPLKLRPKTPSTGDGPKESGSKDPQDPKLDAPDSSAIPPLTVQSAQELASKLAPELANQPAPNPAEKAPDGSQRKP